MKNIFKEHPNSIGETYLQHFLKAFIFGCKLLLLAIKAFVHAIFPFLFEHSVSERVSKLNDILKARRAKDNTNLDKH